MREIIIPDEADSSISLALGGYKYTFHFSYNTTNHRYYLDISRNGVKVISGLKLIENTIITQKHNIPDFDHGELAVLRAKATSEITTRNNIGIDSSYTLVYLPYLTKEGE